MSSLEISIDPKADSEQIDGLARIAGRHEAPIPKHRGRLDIPVQHEVSA